MDQSKATLLVLVFLGSLAVCVSAASILILVGGKTYQKIPEQSRPRRWFVAIFFAYFVLFCLWFPRVVSLPPLDHFQCFDFRLCSFHRFHRGLVCLGKSGGYAVAHSRSDPSNARPGQQELDGGVETPVKSCRIIGNWNLGANSSFVRLHRKARCIEGTIFRRSYEDSAMNLWRSTHDLQLVQFGVCRPPND